MLDILKAAGRDTNLSPVTSCHSMTRTCPLSLPDLNLHIEALDFQTLLRNAKERNNPFFDHLFTAKV